jgi:adenosine deaminase
MSGVSLTDEYVRCAEHLGYDLARLGQLALASFDAAFLPHAARTAMRAEAAREIGLLLADASDVAVFR